jgi:hypothetical protein
MRRRMQSPHRDVRDPVLCRGRRVNVGCLPLTLADSTAFDRPGATGHRYRPVAGSARVGRDREDGIGRVASAINPAIAGARLAR